MCAVAQKKKEKKRKKQTKSSKKTQQKKQPTKKPTSKKKQPTKKTQAKSKKKNPKKQPKKKKKSTKKQVKKKTVKKRNRSNTSNVQNVGRLIRNASELKVSPSFVEEAKGRIEVLLDELVPEAENVARGEGMKTLQEHHLIRVFDFRLPNHYKIVSCSDCGHSFSIAATDAERDMCCPFCGKKRYLSIC